MRSAVLLSLGVLWGTSASAQLGTVEGTWKISQTAGGRVPALDTNDQLGRAVTALGDLDGNGTIDLASAGHGDDDGGIDQGAAYVFFLRSDGRVIATQKISELAGGFTGVLDPGDQFGRAMCSIGDVDGDGIVDLAVGANYDDDGGPNRGAVWLLRLRRDGTVWQTTKISQTQGGFVGPLHNNDEFGRSIADLGDLDGDGDPDIAVAAPTDPTGGLKRGAVWILFLRRDGTVERQVKIASGTGGFTGRLRNTDWFGFSLASIGDFDGDGVVDLAVGTALDDDGAVNAGAVWLLYLKRDGTVKEHRKISMLSGGFTAALESPDQFGTAVCPVGDLNGDGVIELAVSAVKDGDGGLERGAVYVLFMTPLGTVAFHQKISDLVGSFPARSLNDYDWLGSALAPLGDFNRDGVSDLVIGARNDDDGGPNKGALYLTYLEGVSQSLMASSSSRGTLGSALIDLTGAARRGRTVTFGSGPEPAGTLELVAGDGAPGAELTFRLPVPEAFAGQGALVRLLVATRRSNDPARAERTGFLLARSALVGALEAVAAPSHAEVHVTVQLQRDERFRGSALSFQGVWRRGEQRQLTDAVELCLAE